MAHVSIAGDLAVFPIANVLQLLSVSQARGVLRLYRGNQGAALWFEGGELVAAVADPVPVSGHARTAQATATASHSELDALLSAHVSRVVAAIITWSGGQFTFVAEQSANKRDAAMPSVPVERALMTAAWVLDEQRRAG